MKLLFSALLAIILGSSALPTMAAQAPTGVRPCCAFGYDLKAELGGVAVPFFSLNNVLDSHTLGRHRYNDGSGSVALNLAGLDKEKNGLIFTTLGGFIDTAHVRDTADYTYYLYQLMQKNLGSNTHYDFPPELKLRRIQWLPHRVSLTDEQKQALSLDSAALIAFRLAQWHEIAQWFGMESVGGFKEYASAFSSEDLYSNMLGALLAKQILADEPKLDINGFNHAMDKAFTDAIIALEGQPAAITEAKIKHLDGIWWDSSKRLPNKWVVLFRDYRFGLALAPNYPTATHRQDLPSSVNGLAIEQWVRLELHPDQHEQDFAALPAPLNDKPYWTASDFQPIANYAQQQDGKELRARHLDGLLPKHSLSEQRQ